MQSEAQGNLERSAAARELPHVATKSLCAATKTQSSQSGAGGIKKNWGIKKLSVCQILTAVNTAIMSSRDRIWAQFGLTPKPMCQRWSQTVEIGGYQYDMKLGERKKERIRRRKVRNCVSSQYALTNRLDTPLFKISICHFTVAPHK